MRQAERNRGPQPPQSSDLFQKLSPLCSRLQRLTLSGLDGWTSIYKKSLTKFVVDLIKSEPPLTHLKIISYGRYRDY